MISKRSMIKNGLLVMALIVSLTGLVGAQVVKPKPNQDPGKPPTAKPTPEGKSPGSYSGPTGQGQRGGFAPAGVGQPSPYDGPDGVGRPTPQPTGVGDTGGTTPPGDTPGNGTTGGVTPGGNGGITPPSGVGPGGSGPNAPGAGTPGAVPGQRRRGGTTGSLGQGVDELSWQNWWALNEDRLLDLERRYTVRNASREKNPDLFTGDDPSAVPVLIHQSDAMVTKQALPLLKKHLEHDYFGVRLEAAIAIGRIGSTAQVSWLTPLTKDKHRDVRKAAIISLGLLKSERALTMLKFLERDRRTPIIERAYASLAIGLIGKSETASFLIEGLRTGRRVRDLDAARLYALGMIQTPKARRYLDYYVAHPLRDSVMKAVAVNALGLHGHVGTLDTLTKAFEDKDVRVRRSAAAALGRIDFVSRYRAEWDEIDRVLNGDDGNVPSDRVLGELESYRARLEVKLEADESGLSNKRNKIVELLAEKGLRDGDIMVRNFSAISLGRIGGKRPADILIGEISSAKLNSTRSFAAIALALSGDKRAGRELHNRLLKRGLNLETKAAYYLSLGLVGESDAKSAIHKHFKSGGDVAIARYSAIALALLDEQKIKKPLREKILRKSRPELKEA